MKKLIRTINAGLADQRLEDGVLNSVFEMWWPKLNEKITKIVEKHKSKPADLSGIRTDRDLLEEILELARLNASTSMKAVRRSSSVDPDALHHSLKNILVLCERLNEEEIDGLYDLVREIFAPLRYVVQHIEVSKRSDLQLSETIRKIDETLAGRI